MHQQLAGGEPHLGLGDRLDQPLQPLGRGVDVVVQDGDKIGLDPGDGAIHGRAETRVAAHFENARARPAGGSAEPSWDPLSTTRMSAMGWLWARNR